MLELPISLSSASLGMVLVLARMSGLVIFVPILASNNLPHLFRVGLAFSLSLVVYPLVSDRLPSIPSDLVALTGLVAGELMIGFVLGLVGHFFLGAMGVGGELISRMMGFSINRLVDPTTQADSTIMGVLEQLIGTALFLILNAHHLFLEAVTGSYQMNLMELSRIPEGLASKIVQLSSQMLLFGFQIAAPVVIVILIVEIALGLFARAAPQANIFILGLALKVLVGIAVFMTAGQFAVSFVSRRVAGLEGDLIEVMRVWVN